MGWVKKSIRNFGGQISIFWEVVSREILDRFFLKFGTVASTMDVNKHMKFEQN